MVTSLAIYGGGGDGGGGGGGGNGGGDGGDGGGDGGGDIIVVVEWSLGERRVKDGCA